MKSIIKSILKSAFEFFFHTLLGWIVLSIGGISTIALLAWDSIVEIALIDIEPSLPRLKIYEILILLSGLVALLFLIKFFVNKIRNPKRFRFFVEGGFAWKVNRFTGDINYEPYCKKHEMKLISTRANTYHGGGGSKNYYCTECGAMIEQNYDERKIGLCLQIVENRVEALMDSSKL